MKQTLLKWCLFIVAWFALGLGLLGIVLPLLPATPFFILALLCFSKSSPRFKLWLLNHPVIGKDLRRWHEHKKIDKKRKPAIYISIILSFLISISLLKGSIYLQLMLICLMLVLLFCIKRLPEYQTEK